MTDHRQLAVGLFNHTWTLLDNDTRTQKQDEEMVHAARASRHHCSIAGTQKNHARGDWQIARVYAAVSRYAESEHYSKLYLESCQQNEFEDWDLPFAFEGLARACVVTNPEQSKKCITEARQLAEKIAGDDEKHWLFTNLDEIAAMIDA